MNRAARAMPRPRWGRGFSLLDVSTLRRNLSFVLHEHSASGAVTEVARACDEHAQYIARLDPQSLPMAPTTRLPDEDVDVWLTATLGLPAATVRILSITGASVLFTDVHSNTPAAEQVFFRAPAHLSLPTDTSLRVGVGAVILRPGATTTRLVTNGPFTWPDDRPTSIQALEGLIQRYTDQWMPRTPLWPAPVETLLGPGEIRLAE